MRRTKLIVTSWAANVLKVGEAVALVVRRDPDKLPDTLGYKNLALDTIKRQISHVIRMLERDLIDHLFAYCLIIWPPSISSTTPVEYVLPIRYRAADAAS